MSATGAGCQQLEVAMDTKNPVARALALFDDYVEMPPTELPEALARLQADEPGVCTELMRLLAADERTYTFPSPLRWLPARDVAGPAGFVAERDHSDTIWPDGTRLGPWRIEGILGLGGMGVVYAAQRVDGLYEREVALKTLRAELMSPALQQAFAKERQHLAKLDHPSIVALLDAGIAENGQPWFAMQRVHGVAIDQWCDTYGADLRTRVRMIAEACGAIACAHAHGVLHQDIKPPNLLVTDEGKVKLVDFGLSAMLAPHGESGFERVGMSSAYAAPEVFEGAPPSIAIDVYALGVVLYRLLCDGWPRRPRTSASMLSETDDLLWSPSRLAIDASPDAVRSRGLRDAQALSRALRDDADAIALRCVRKAPDERYPDVAALQADLQAWLDRAPVAARGNDVRYRATLFVRRHALPLLFSAGFAVVMAMGVAVVLHQHRHARQEAENAEVLSQLFERTLGAAALSSLGDAPLSSRALLADTERMLRTQAGQAGSTRMLARGLTTLARAYLIGGDYDKAEHLAVEAKALGLNDRLQAVRTDAVVAQLLNLRARHVEAERLVRDALASMPSRPGTDDELVRLDLQMQLARARWARGDPKNALAILDAAVLSADRLGEDGVSALAELLGQRGYARTRLFQFKVAEQDFRRGLTVLGKRSPMVANTLRRELANLLIVAGRLEEALREAQDSLDSNLRIFGPPHPETGRAWIVVGKASFFLGESGRARMAVDKALTILEAQVGTDHPDLAEALVVRSGLAFEQGDLAATMKDARKAADLLERAYGRRHEATLKRLTDLASLLIMRAESSEGPGGEADYREAAGLLSDAIGTGKQLGLPMGYARDEYASVLLHFGKLQAADEQAQRAIDEMSALFGRNNGFAMPGHLVLLKVRTRQERYDDAADIGEQLLARAEPEEVSSYTRYLILEMLLENEIARGDPRRIRHAYQEAERVAQRHGFMDALKAKRVPGIASVAG
jgi:eukaryotic-like serine/threonine-protein kinase